jgi:hypothetical protein
MHVCLYIADCPAPKSHCMCCLRSARALPLEPCRALFESHPQATRAANRVHFNSRPSFFGVCIYLYFTVNLPPSSRDTHLFPSHASLSPSLALTSLSLSLSLSLSVRIYTLHIFTLPLSLFFIHTHTHTHTYLPVHTSLSLSMKICVHPLC